jgi:hypothetical protein
MTELALKNFTVTLGPAPGTCVLCHTVDRAVTNERLAAGGSWRCIRCGQMWDTARLRAADAYAGYLATRERSGD